MLQLVLATSAKVRKVSLMSGLVRYRALISYSRNIQNVMLTLSSTTKELNLQDRCC